ncbi:MAG: MFS transporter [Nitriliruptoraceae bacterium]
MTARAGAVRQVLAERNFRTYIVGLSLSNVGTWLQNIAAGLLVYGLTESTLLVGVVNFAQFAGTLVLAPWSGAAADRFDRRRLLVVTQSAAATVGATLAIATWLGWVSVPIVIGASLVLGFAIAFATPAMMSLVPQLVDREHLDTAVALNSATFNVARAVGPVIGAALVDTVGFAAAFGLNAASFGCFAVVLITIHARENDRVLGARPKLSESIRLVAASPRLRALLTAIMAVSVTTDPTITLTPEFVRDVFVARDLYVGLLMGSFGVGATFTALVLSGWLQRQRRVLAIAMTVQGIGVVMVGVAPTVEVALVGFAISGGGFMAALTRCTARLYAEVPDQQRGRIMALWSLAFLGSRPIAALVDGIVAEVAGVRVAALVLAAPVLVTGVWVARRMPPYAPAAGDVPYGA